MSESDFTPESPERITSEVPRSSSSSSSRPSSLEETLDRGLNETEFKEFIRALLSTFMTEEYLRIYMSDEMTQRPRSQPSVSRITTAEPLKVPGPFSIIRRAFTHSLVSDLNLETLEGYGDAVLNTVIMSFIMKNWPNLRSAKIIADMKQYYLKNSTFAIFAQQLNLIRWVRRDPLAGLTQKDRGDVFESFIGAIAMIGEFYIADYIGFVLVSEFMYKFLSLQEWHPEDTSFYQVQSSLYNDWKEALPVRERPNLGINYGRTTTDGFHVAIVTLTGERIRQLTGENILRIDKSDPFKDDAREKAFEEVNRRLGIDKDAIAAVREEKRVKNAELATIISNFNNRYPDKVLQITRANQRGQRYFVYIREKKNVRAGPYTLSYSDSVARGVGDNEESAIRDAINRYRNGNLLIPIAGTDENMDDPDVLAAAANLPNKYPLPRVGLSGGFGRKEKPTSTKSGRGYSGRGGSGRGAGGRGSGGRGGRPPRK